ncbi:MAG: hypothetical protein GY765_14545 [bacterium]|nr:hypothetical protein [bacterium]
MAPAANENVEREFSYISSGVDTNSALWKYLQWVKKSVLPAMVEKDALAMEFHKKHVAVTKFIYMASAFVIFLVIVQTLFLPKYYPLIWGEVVLLGIMLFRQKLSHKRGYQEKWLSNRFITEKLRFTVFTQLFKGDSGSNSKGKTFLRESDIDSAADEVLHSLDMSGKPQLDIRVNLAGITAFIKTNWLESQKKFQAKTRRNSHQLLKRMERVCFIGLILTIFAAIAHSMGWGHYTKILDPFGPSDAATAGVFTIGNLLIVLSISLPAFSAGLNAIKGSFELEKITMRCGKIIKGIDEYLEDLAKVDTAEELEPLVQDIESFFMSEHEEWFSLLAHHNPEVG